MKHNATTAIPATTATTAIPAAAASDGVVYENHSASEPLVVLRHFAENPELPAR